MRQPCPHGDLYKVRAHNGGRFCSKCWNERKNTGKKVLHDKRRNQSFACVDHGPHFTVESWQGRFFCLACGPSKTDKISVYAKRDCHVCEQEEKKQRQLDELEKITRPTYDETVVNLGQIEGFTRIKSDAAERD